MAEVRRLQAQIQKTPPSLLGTALAVLTYPTSGTIPAGGTLDLAQASTPFIFNSVGDPDIAVVTSPSYGIEVSSSGTPALYVVTTDSGLSVASSVAGEFYLSILSVAAATPPIIPATVSLAQGAFFAFDACLATVTAITSGTDTWVPDILVQSTASASRGVVASAGGDITLSLNIARFGLPS